MVAKINNMIYRPPIPQAKTEAPKPVKGLGIPVSGDQTFFLFDNYNNKENTVDGNMHPYAKAKDWPSMVGHCPQYSLDHKTPVDVYIDAPDKAYGIVARYDEGQRIMHS